VATDFNGNTNAITELVTVNPTAPSVAPVAVLGVEGQAIALNLGIAATSASGETIR